MRRLITPILIIFLTAFEFHAQTTPQATPAKPVLDANQLAVGFLDRMNALDDWYISVDGKEEGVDQVVNRMMDLFAPDVIAEIPPHDEEQLGPVMLLGTTQVRKWVEQIARSQVTMTYICKRQTTKEFEGEYMIFSKPLPWGGLGVSFQIIAASSLREDRRRYMEAGAVFLQVREDGKIQRLRLILSEKVEVTEQ